MLESLGQFFVRLVILAITLPLRGYAILKLWAWFIVPLGVSSLGFWHALGFALIASYLTYDVGALMARGREDKRTFTEKAVEDMIMGVLLPLWALTFGWLYYSFM